MEDGAGICSPGRWRPGYRNLPDVGSLGNDLINAMGINMDAWDWKVCAMMAGKMLESPFSEKEKERANTFMHEWCREQGFPATIDPSDVHHDHPYFDLRLLQAFLRRC